MHLANLSFAQLELLDRDVWLAEDIAAITPDTAGLDDYLPERTLARWLAAHDLPSTVYAFPKTGVQPLRAAYRHLVDDRGVDAIVLVDGGTDILMRVDGLAKRCLYLDRLESTYGMRQVSGRIARFRDEITTRVPRAFPH